MQQQTPKPPPRLAELEAGDALRGVGVVTVVLFHILAGVLLLDTGTYDFRDGYGRVVSSAILGVQANIFMFFALSAFLLSRPYVRAAMFGARFPSTSRYVRHRIGRIVPGLWAAMAVVLIAYGTQGSSTSEVLAVFGFAQVYEHGQVTSLLDQAWSVDVEVVFYLLLVPMGAGAVWAMRRWPRRGGLVIAAGIIAVTAVGAALQHKGIDPAVPVDQSPLGGLRTFIPGIFLAVIAVRWPDPGWWRRLPWWSSWALLAAGLFLSWRMPTWAPHGGNPRVYIGTLGGGCILAAAIIRQYRGDPVWRLLRSRVVIWIGERSYSMYLIHGVVFYALRDIGEGQPTTARRLLVNLCVSLPAIAAATQVMFVLIERPAMMYSRRRRPSDRGAVRPVAAAQADAG